MYTAAEGILLVDKPLMLTSHDVVNRVRRLTGVRRIGHSGTLDPLATGLLILCIGRATRLAEYLTGLPKTYEAEVRLGVETSTYDLEGEILEEKPVNLSGTEIAAALDLFRGEINQVPPMYSAVKVDGQPLYRLARQGLEVTRPPRTVTIYRLELLDWEPPNLQLTISCTAGTYIRSIAHDLGQVLGCGGTLSRLRRTRAGNFDLTQAVELEMLNQATWFQRLLPLDAAVRHLPSLIVSVDEAVSLFHGKTIARLPDHTEADLVSAYDEDGMFIGIVTAVSDGPDEGEGKNWRAKKVFYRPGQ